MRIPIPTSLLIAASLVGCDKSPNIVTTQATDSPPRVEAAPFQGRTYRTFDGRKALTLISRDECEFRDDQTTLLCKYNQQDNTLRVVMNVLGTQQVVYFRNTTNGIQDNQGTEFLTPQAHTARVTELREREERAQNAREEIQARLRAERDRRQHLRAKATAQPTKPIRSFNIPQETFAGFSTIDRVDVADKALTLHNKDSNESITLWFFDFDGLSDEPGGDRSVQTRLIHVGSFEKSPNRIYEMFYVDNQRWLADFKSTVEKAYTSWKKQYPDAAALKGDTSFSEQQ